MSDTLEGRSTLVDNLEVGNTLEDTLEGRNTLEDNLGVKTLLQAPWRGGTYWYTTWR